MLVRSHRRVLAAAIGVLLSMGVAVPASAAPASPQPSSSVQRLLALQSLMAVLDARSGSVPNSVTGWYVDPASNSVVVSTTDDTAARAFAAGQRNVRIEHVNVRPRLLADLRGGDTISTSVGGRCSVGFNAV